MESSIRFLRSFSSARSISSLIESVNRRIILKHLLKPIGVTVINKLLLL
jgi:hypothetical protein